MVSSFFKDTLGTAAKSFFGHLMIFSIRKQQEEEEKNVYETSSAALYQLVSTTIQVP